MLTLHPDALKHIESRQRSIFLELPIVIQGDITFRECPSVRWGEPRDIKNYERRTIQGIVVFVPRELPTIPLEVVLTGFLRFKWLAVHGWRMV